jgi:dipeptidyl aminopeptidase/acylaminoacyl peptidase
MLQLIKKELQNIKNVMDFEVVNFDNELQKITDKRMLQNYTKKLEKVLVIRFMYRVNQINVVGYLSVPKTREIFPAIIHLRGGSRSFGALCKKALLINLVNYSAEGYVVISTQYPGVDGGDGADHWGDIDDLKSISNLFSILKSFSFVDRKRVGMKGHSRGGLMTYMMLRDVKWIKSAVIASTPTDQVRQGKERPGWREHQISLWGKSRKETIKRSPLRWVDDLPKKIPLLIMHGSSDWRVNPLDSIEMSKAMYERKIPHRFILFEGADHGITEYKNEYFNQTLNWFNRYLKSDEKLPDMKHHGN